VKFVRVEVNLLRQVGEELFRQAGLSQADAATVVRVQIDADLTGMYSHGMRAVPTYLRRIEAGIINPQPRLRTVAEHPSAATVDGDAGPGQVVAHHAMSRCIEKARQQGIAFVTARNSNHFGAAGYYARMAANENLVGFATTNGNLVLAPVGGISPTLGNNPMAYAFPAGEEPPVVLDVATSVVAGGKIDLAAAEGDSLPAGWAMDASSQPTLDPVKASRGLGIPLGAPTAGHKGFGLAFAMEILAGALSGANFGTQHTLEVESGPRPWNEGHFFCALDPALVMPLGDFTGRIDQLVRQTRAAETRLVTERPRAPGELAHARRERALADGLQLPVSIYGAIKALADDQGLSTRLP
jgi:LDH2 family malate/lactate/ureidoglycolate dehydrogenase